MARVTCDVQKFKRKQKVVAAIDLPGVPTGTPGKVFYEAGVRWFRYHVRFENGVELGQVDGNALMTTAEWDLKQRDAVRAERLAAREARAAEVVVSTGPHGH